MKARMIIGLTVLMVLVTGLAGAQDDTPGATPTTTPTAESIPEGVLTADLTLTLGDFESAAQITYPAQGEGPFGVVILIHGSGPADMDFTYTDLQGNVVSTIFRDIATYLPTQGYAVLRYNKRYVSGPNQADAQRYYQLGLPDLVDDAGVALDAALDHDLLDADHVYLYGWSEGSVIASSLAAQRPDDVAGLIWQGPVGLGWRENFIAQLEEVGVPYLREFAPDGNVTAETLETAFNGGGGSVALSGVIYALDVSYYQTGEFAVNTILDANGDGVLSLDDEYIPMIPDLIDFAMSPQSFLGMYGESRNPLQPLVEQAADLPMPVLILQGENDASTPVRGAEVLADALAESGNEDVTLVIYPGLGHSLGPADDLIDDRFRPIVQEPLVDLAGWLDEHSG